MLSDCAVAIAIAISHALNLTTAEQDDGLAAGVTGQQGMLTPPGHLIPPLVCPGIRVCITCFVFYLGLTRLIIMI